MTAQRSLIVSLLGLALAACGVTVSAETRLAYGAARIPLEDCGARSASEVTPEEMARDWEFVEHVLRRGYAGFELAGNEARWARAFEVGRAGLPTRPRSAVAFRDYLVREFGFVDDNHLSFTVLGDAGRDWRSTSGHRQAYLAAERFDAAGRSAEGHVLESCEDRPARDVLVAVAEPDGGVRWAPLVLSESGPETVRCALRDAAGARVERELALRRVELGDARGPGFERRAGELPWLRLRTLVASRQDELERFVASAAAVREAPIAVLDLRDIGGGADRYLNQWFSAYTNQDLQYWDTRRITSEVALQGALSFWGCIGASSQGDAGGRAWVSERVARARRELDEAMQTRGVFRELADGEYVVRGVAPSAPRGTLIVLVNRRCASACETSVMLARQLPNAIVLGENTEGTMRVGEIRAYRLPESGIAMTAGTRIHMDPSTGTFDEGIGYLPDLWLAGDADRAVPALARCLGEPSCAAELRTALRDTD